MKSPFTTGEMAIEEHLLDSKHFYYWSALCFLHRVSSITFVVDVGRHLKGM